MKKNPIKKAVAIAGSQAKLAALVGRKQQTVDHWIKKGVPAKHVLRLEHALNGAVTRYELRPDLYPPSKITTKP